MIKRVLGKRTVFEAGGIPCLVWLAVIVLAWNHLVLGVVLGVVGMVNPAAATLLREMMPPVPLPEGYWDALTWVILGLFGKKVGDKWVQRPEHLPPLGEREL